MNRSLTLIDKNSLVVSESDLLVIDVAAKKEDDNFFRSNMGRTCKEQNVSRVEVQLINTYPLLKVHYEVRFLPTTRVEVLNDETFLSYLTSESINQTKFPYIEVNLSDSHPTDIFYNNGERVLTNDSFIIPREKLNYSLMFKEGFITPELHTKIDKIKVVLGNRGFRIQTKYYFIAADGRLLNNKEIYKLTDDCYQNSSEQDRRMMDEEYEGLSMPFHNEGEAMFKKFLEMNK